MNVVNHLLREELDPENVSCQIRNFKWKSELNFNQNIHTTHTDNMEAKNSKAASKPTPDRKQ